MSTYSPNLIPDSSESPQQSNNITQCIPYSITQPNSAIPFSNHTSYLTHYKKTNNQNQNTNPCTNTRLLPLNTNMNPYAFNPYAMAAVNLAHYNAATANGQSTTSNTTTNSNPPPPNTQVPNVPPTTTPSNVPTLGGFAVII